MVLHGIQGGHDIGSDGDTSMMTAKKTRESHSAYLRQTHSFVLWEYGEGQLAFYTEDKEIAERAKQAGLRHLGKFVKIPARKSFAVQFYGSRELVCDVLGISPESLFYLKTRKGVHNEPNCWNRPVPDEYRDSCTERGRGRISRDN